MPQAVTMCSHGTHYLRWWKIFVFFPHLARSKWKWGNAGTGMKWVACECRLWLRKWKGMTSSGGHCVLAERGKGRGGERQRGRQSYEPLVYSSLLMTPTVPFLPKARITIKPESHLLTWSSILPKVYSHTCTDVSTHRMVEGGSEGWKRGRLSGGHGTNRGDVYSCSTRGSVEQQSIE